MSIRTERVASLLQRDIADLLQNTFGDQLHPLVTVTGVRMTKDLSIAYVDVSVMGDEAGQQAAFRRLTELTPQVRTALAARIRHQMRVVPELRFFLDESQERARHMDALFSRIRAEREHRLGSDEAGQDDALAGGA